MAIQSLSPDELLRLLGAARERKARDWLMILVGFWHGLRASEVVEIVGSDIQNGMLDVHRLKGSERTIQPLVAHENPLLSEREPLIELAAKSVPNQKLFPWTRQTFWNIVQRAGAAANLPAHKRHPHVLKHTIATQTIQTAGIENVRAYLGHKSMASTGEYLKVTDEDAARAVHRSFRGLIV